MVKCKGGTTGIFLKIQKHSKTGRKKNTCGSGLPVSYREKIRVGRSEINFFFEYFFHGFVGFLLGDLQ